MLRRPVEPARQERTLTNADLAANAAAISSIGLVTAHYLAMMLLDVGSPMPSKNASFLMVTMSALVVARALSSANAWSKLHPAYIDVHSGLVVAVILYGPRTSLYTIVRDLNYAERASQFPEFKPGSTFVAASSINPVIKYWISIFRVQERT